MEYRIVRISEKGDLRIYQRCFNESGVKRYFAYNTQKEQATGDEFRDIRQARKFLDKNS